MNSGSMDWLQQTFGPSGQILNLAAGDFLFRLGDVPDSL